MIFYLSDKILVRNMIAADGQILAMEEVAQGWLNSTADKFEMRLRDQREGRSIALVAEYRGNPAGYVNVYMEAVQGPFAGKGCPEIVDFAVLEKYRRKGIGAKLMDIAEKTASEHSDTVCLAVGLHTGYGAAQRMYVKRGYIPDGTGVWYGKDMCRPYGDYCNDDDLNLYFYKELKNSDTENELQ